MITAERLAAYKTQAIAAVASRANNPAAPGVACVNASPHDMLDLIQHYEANCKALDFLRLIAAGGDPQQADTIAATAVDILTENQHG